MAPGSHKKVWWKCSKGHEWKSSISNRIKGNSCPFCSGRNAIKGVNDFATLYPELLKEWDYEKNKMISPDEVKTGSEYNVWWKCNKCKNSWQMKVKDRTLKHFGCPYCSGHRVLKGVNDLQTVCPEVAKEWNYDKNGELLPTQVTKSSNEKVWWKCSKGHEWIANIYNRVRNKSACPYCSGRMAITGLNDLATVCPNLSKEWNYKKNIKVLPTEILAGSGIKVWWKCSKCGYEWEARIVDRRDGQGCPKCSIQKVANLKRKSVNQYSLDNKFIRRYESISEAQNITGISKISMVCSGKRKTAGGYIWKYDNKNNE